MCRAETRYPKSSTMDLPTSSDAVSLSTSDGPPPPLSEPTHVDSASSEVEESRKVGKKDPGSHMDMAELDMHMPPRASKSLQRGRITNSSSDGKDIHALREKQLLAVDKNEIQKIYEQKNYMHLRPEQLKNLRLVSRPRSSDTEPVTTSVESESNKSNK